MTAIADLRKDIDRIWGDEEDPVAVIASILSGILDLVERLDAPSIPVAHPESIGPTGLLVGHRPSEVGTATVDLAAAPTPAIDRERLAEAIYAVSIAHNWANTTDTLDRTDEIADGYEALAALAASPDPREETTPTDLGQQIAAKGGLPRGLRDRIDRIERGERPDPREETR